MRNRAILAAIAGTGVADGLYLDHVPAWRQLLFVVLAIAAYLQGRHLTERGDQWVLAAAAVPGLICLIPAFSRGAGALMALGLFVVLPWLAGRFRRQQARLVLAGHHHIARLVRERELVAEQARLRERARIAADMHDSLGHELALIALRAGALELAAGMSEPNRRAAADLRISAVTATDRLRRTVHLLRDHDPAANGDPSHRDGRDHRERWGREQLRSGGAIPPEGQEAPAGEATAPVAETVEELVGRARAAGMAVELRGGDVVDGLPRPVERAVHRVVRESLTNAARHAPGASVLVHLTGTGGEVVVTIRDTGSSTAMSPSPASARLSSSMLPSAGRPPVDGKRPVPGGSGLAGLREQARLLGGSLEAEPYRDGFVVTARFPRGRGEVGR